MQRPAPIVGIFSGYLAGAYEGPIISAVLRSVSQAGGNVIAVQTAGTGSDYHSGVTLRDLARVGWDHIDAVVTIANAVPPGYLEALGEAGKAVVAIGNEQPGYACPVVVTDNASGIRQAVGHLVRHGHRRIAFVGCLDQFDIRARYEAYCSALADHGIAVDPSLLFEAENNFEHGAAPAARAMLDAGLPSTAVLAATDLNAVGVVRALKQAGYLLPRDQAVVGFDDGPDCALLSPSLSSVAQDLDRLGSLAAELVLSQLSGATVAPGRYVVPSSYVQRESCGCLPAGHGVTAQDRPGAGDAVERFTQSIVAADLSHGPATELTVRNLALQVHDIYLDAAQREPTASSLMRLSQICEDIYWHHPARSTFDAIESLALQLSSELQAALGELAPGAGERLDHCTAQVRLSLNKALLDVRNNSYYELRKAIRNEYHITLDLLNNHDKDPRLLEWMRYTDARLGVLALWQHERPEQGPAAKALTAPDEPPLDIVGTFDASGQHLELPSNTTNVGSFPPLTLLDTQGDPSFVCVFPVKSPVKDWGFLAIAQPAGDRLDQEAYFTWSALFSEAMDYRALLRSLQQKSEDLALSYERERDMAQAIRESEERYALAARAANDGLWDWDLSKGTIYYSSRWKQMLGFAEDEITSSPDEWLRRAHHDDRALLISELEDLKRGRSASIMNEHRVLARDGTYIWVLCRGLAVPGEGRPATRVVGSFTDVTQRRALEDRLRRQALYDSLTGLANRLLFLDRLSQAMASAKRRAGWSYTVLWLDLDNFKQLNDSLGHLYGDKLLVQVAERIRAHIRETDTASRFGGDEFVLLLQDADDPKSLEAVVRRLSERLNEPYDLDGQVVTVTASIGVAISTAGYERPEEVLRDADLAMYRAKAIGHGTYVKFNSALSSAPGR